MFHSSSYPSICAHDTSTVVAFRSASLHELQHNDSIVCTFQADVTEPIVMSDEGEDGLDATADCTELANDQSVHEECSDELSNPTLLSTIENHDEESASHFPDSDLESVSDQGDYFHEEVENGLPGSRRRRCQSDASSDAEPEFYDSLSCYTDDKELSVLETDDVQIQSDLSDSKSPEPHPTADREENVDADKDKSNPAYIPRTGKFFMHDFRLPDESNASGDSVVAKSRADRGQWQHDLFRYYDQAPCSRQEIIRKYGYDIREEQSVNHASSLKSIGSSALQHVDPHDDQSQSHNVCYSSTSHKTGLRSGRFTKSHHKNYNDNRRNESRNNHANRNQISRVTNSQTQPRSATISESSGNYYDENRCHGFHHPDPSRNYSAQSFPKPALSTSNHNTDQFPELYSSASRSGNSTKPQINQSPHYNRGPNTSGKRYSTYRQQNHIIANQNPRDCEEATSHFHGNDVSQLSGEMHNCHIGYESQSFTANRKDRYQNQDYAPQRNNFQHREFGSGHDPAYDGRYVHVDGRRPVLGRQNYSSKPVAHYNRRFQNYDSSLNPRPVFSK